MTEPRHLTTWGFSAHVKLPKTITTLIEYLNALKWLSSLNTLKKFLISWFSHKSVFIKETMSYLHKYIQSNLLLSKTRNKQLIGINFVGLKQFGFIIHCYHSFCFLLCFVMFFCVFAVTDEYMLPTFTATHSLQ